MTRPPKRLQDSIEVVRCTPTVATAMLIHGLLPADQAETFKPAKLPVESIIKMLHQANEVRNRTISLPHVMKLSRDMTNGNWLWTGDPIHVDTDGFIRNGQHRLLAVVHSGITQDFNVVRNLHPKAQLVIDVGRPRSVANQLHMAGVSNASNATAVANMLIRWRVGKVMLSTYIPTVSEVNELISSEPAMVDALTMVYRFRKNIGTAPVAALGSTFIEAGHIDEKARDEFFEDLIVGADLAVDDPVFVLRNTLIRTPSIGVRARRAGRLFQIVHAWNAWRKDETIRFLRVPTTLTSETFPKMR